MKSIAITIVWRFKLKIQEFFELESFKVCKKRNLNLFKLISKTNNNQKKSYLLIAEIVKLLLLGIKKGFSRVDKVRWGVQLTVSSLRMCTLGPWGNNPRKLAFRKSRRKVFELSSQSVFYSPATHTPALDFASTDELRTVSFPSFFVSVSYSVHCSL